METIDKVKLNLAVDAIRNDVPLQSLERLYWHYLAEHTGTL